MMAKIRRSSDQDDNPRPKKKQSTMLLTKSEFPNHLIYDAILHKLPPRSLTRFRSVCKSWDSFIRDPSFVQLRRSADNIHGYFVFVSWDPQADKMDTSNPHVFLMPFHRNNEESQAAHSLLASPTHILTMSKFSYCDCGVQCVNGFLCFHHKNGELLCHAKNGALTQIVNPTTGQFITLPPDNPSLIPQETIFATHFGFDPLGDEFKVLRFYKYRFGYEFKILTVGSDSGWRGINPTTPFQPLSCDFIVIQRGFYFNGAIYWLDLVHRRTIVAFDVGREEFRKIIMHDGITKCSMQYSKFVEVGGRLGVLGYDSYRNPKYLWILKNSTTSFWTKECINELPYEFQSRSRMVTPLCQLGNGEIMFLPYIVNKRLRVYYYDLMKKTAVRSKVIMEMPQPLWPHMHDGELDFFFIQESFKVLKPSG